MALSESYSFVIFVAALLQPVHELNVYALTALFCQCFNCKHFDCRNSKGCISWSARLLMSSISSL